MKKNKFVSLLLAMVMAASLAVPAFAGTREPATGEVDPYPAETHSTAVTYTGTGVESYTVTVPATLAPGGSGEVKVQGTWASNRKLTVTAPSSVTLTNSIDSGTKTLAVTFAGIAKTGDNTVAVSDTKTISVAEISNALFGTWSGTISYTVSMGNAA